MSARDNQSAVRERIAQAAEKIVRADGAEKLTMRRLAEEAGVALKTPYNVYGSKTAVLIALLDQATASLMAGLDQESDSLIIMRLINILDGTATFFGADEAYYRGIFWAVMTSDQPELRSAAHDRITGLVVAWVVMAKEAGELSAATTPEVLGGQLGLNLLANMGSWAGGHLSIAQAMAHTKIVWASLLQGAGTKASTGKLAETLRSAQAGMGSLPS